MEKEKTNEKSQGLSKVLGPMHIWALGVGIVLVGEFMGWNFTVAKGGSIGSVIALWTVAMLYVMIVMMNTEMGSVMPEAGGQYTMAKYMLGPLAAFNVGLMLVLEYAMLEAADVLVVGQILESLNPNVKALPFKSACADIYELPWCLCNIDPEFCDYGSCICDDIYFIIFNKLL